MKLGGEGLIHCKIDVQHIYLFIYFIFSYVCLFIYFLFLFMYLFFFLVGGLISTRIPAI